MLVDLSSGQILHAREENRRFVPASITKVMTAYVAFDLIEQGLLDPRQVFEVRRETGNEWGGKGSSMFLEAGDRVLVSDLLTGITTVSANDGSIVLAEGQAGSVEAWIELMNQTARKIGMANSHFGTPNGWPDEGHTFTTASDLVALAQALITDHPRKYARYFGQTGFRYNNIAQDNRDPWVGRVNGADGIKTGYTNEAGFGFLGSAERNGRRLVVVVAGIDRQSIRNRASREYLEWGFSAFEQRQLFQSGESVGTVRVQGGSSRALNVVTDRPVRINLPRDGEADFDVAIQYDGPLRAPIAAGTRVASLRITTPGMQPAIVPLLAASDVGRADFFDRLLNGIAGWFS